MDMTQTVVTAVNTANISAVASGGFGAATDGDWIALVIIGGLFAVFAAWGLWTTR